MPLATDIYSGNVFRFMKSEQSMAGEDSEPEKTSSELAGTHFTIEKKPMKISESKRSEIEIIAEFRGIPNGFPNLEDHPPSLRGTMRPGIIGGSARGEASWVPLRATTGHDKR